MAALKGMRRHHNNKGVQTARSGRTTKSLKAIAKKLKIKFVTKTPPTS